MGDCRKARPSSANPTADTQRKNCGEPNFQRMDKLREDLVEVVRLAVLVLGCKQQARLASCAGRAIGVGSNLFPCVLVPMQRQNPRIRQHCSHEAEQKQKS